MTNNLYSSYQDITYKSALRTVAVVMLLLVCAFVLMVAFGGSPQVARAETLSQLSSDGSITYYLDYGVLLDSTSATSFSFNGAPSFSLDFPTLSSNTYYLPFNKALRDKPALSFTFQDRSVNQMPIFSFSTNGAFRFPRSNVTSNTVTFVVPSGLTYNFFLLFYNEDGAFSESYYRINDVPLSDLTTSYMRYDIGLNVPVDKQSDGSYKAYIRDSSDTRPRFSLELDINNLTLSTDTNPFTLYSFTLGAGSYVLRGTTSNSVYSYVVGMWLSHYISTEFTKGYDVGYINGYNNGVTDGQSSGYNVGYNDGLANGISQANNTVTDTSASYQAGYSKGVDAAGKYTFMSLISSVIDAPIRAFFGYKDADGVTHTGLFNLNILGYDMSALVLSLFSACVIIMIIKLCLGGK